MGRYKGKRVAGSTENRKPEAFSEKPVGDPFAGDGEKPGFSVRMHHFWDSGKGKILLAVVASIAILGGAAGIARQTRSSMLEVIHNDSIKALRARGIKESSVIWKHAFKNALPPIVTVLGLQLASAFTGAILTESIFSWPGMGTMIVSAIDNRDYMLIQGTVLFIAVVFVIVNLLVDVVYMLINPRVSYEAKGGN